MPLTDEQFREEFKPIVIPSHYNIMDSHENKVIYALAQIGEGTAEDVNAELDKLEPGLVKSDLKGETEVILHHLYDKGLIKGDHRDGRLYYNLSKITEANTGEVDPDLLAPGLD